MTRVSTVPRQIKRYENRKLYDTTDSSYVSLRDIADLVRDGETVIVIDNVTGQDITGQTLTQVILEEGRRGRSSLSTEVLHDLLRRGSAVLDTGIEQVRSGLDELVHRSVRQLSELAHVPSASDIDRLEKRLSELERVVSELLVEMRARGAAAREPHEHEHRSS